MKGLSLSLPFSSQSIDLLTTDSALVYGLGALKNVGVDAMGLVAEGRGDKAFITLFDFARRVDLKRVGKRPLETLIEGPDLA